MTKWNTVGKNSGQEAADNRLRPGSAIYYLFDLQQDIQLPCNQVLYL